MHLCTVVLDLNDISKVNEKCYKVPKLQTPIRIVEDYSAYNLACTQQRLYIEREFISRSDWST